MTLTTRSYMSLTGRTGTAPGETIDVSGWTPYGIQKALDRGMIAPRPEATDESAFATKESTSTASITGNTTIDLADGSVQDITVGANITLTLPAVSSLDADSAQGLTLRLRQDATGSRTITFGDSIRWAGGTAPTLTTTASAIDVLVFIADPADDVWDGFASGLAMATP